MITEEHKETAQEAPKSAKPTPSNKPVLTYVIILFLAAFFLMALSLMMHQRSNTETLGEIRSDLSVMQDIQDAQEQIISLQDELDETKELLNQAEDEAGEATARLDAALIDLEAQRALYAIQQKYAVGDYEGCDVLIKEMESSGLAALLPSSQMSTSVGSVTAPSVRFQQFKYAVQEKLAEQAKDAQAEAAN